MQWTTLQPNGPDHLDALPGPVVLALPEDVLAALPSEDVRVPPRALVPIPAPDPAAVAAVVKLLSEAANPMLLIGGGGWTSGATVAVRLMGPTRKLYVSAPDSAGAQVTALATDFRLAVATAFRRQVEAHHT